MKRLNTFLKQLTSSLIYWVSVMLLYQFLRHFGLDEEDGVHINKAIFGKTEEWLLVSFICGIVLGIFYALIELLTDQPFFKRKSVGFTLLSKLLLYTFLLLFTANVVKNVILELFPWQTVPGPIIFYKSFWAFVVFFIISSFLYSFFEMVSQKFGHGVMFNMILGKYRVPKEEKRIFMFIDLKSSTSIAEKLGHFKYSKLIQQCFYDLNEAVFELEGEIYQYVGDEAVISWPYQKGIQENKCIDCFFSFLNKIHEKSDFYNGEFGLVPEFKAGLHGGDLIVTEVGIMKKEIAYHGDVINTAARIQSECNNYDEKLLLSENLLSDLDHKKLNIKQLGEIILKGKLEPVAILAVK